VLVVGEDDWVLSVIVGVTVSDWDADLEFVEILLWLMVVQLFNGHVLSALPEAEANP
jgi:hypothetical protein